MERVISHTVSVLSQEADATLRVEMTLTGVCHCPRQIISNTARCIPILLPPRSFLRVHRRPWKRDSCTRNEMEAVRVCVCVCVCVCRCLYVCARKLPCVVSYTGIIVRAQRPPKNLFPRVSMYLSPFRYICIRLTGDGYE